MKNKKILVSILLIITILSSSIEVLAKSFDLSVIFDGRTIAMESEDTDMNWDLLNFIPGSSDTSSVTITNTGAKPATVDTRINIEENNGLLDMIDLTVKNKAGETVYTGSYTEYKDISKVFAVGETETYTVETKMNVNAGNEYQNKEYKLTFSFKATGQIPMGTLTVKYVDENGEDLEPSQIDTKKITERYELPETGKDFEGYKFDNVTGPTSGYYEEDGVEVVYHYHLLKYGKLIVKHVYDDVEDENERLIKQTEDIQEVNTEYHLQSEILNINGYTVSKVEGNLDGVYTEDDTIVTIHYDKRTIPQPPKPTPEVITDMSKVIILYVDENEKEIEKEVYIDEVGKDYKFTQEEVKKDIPGYEFKKIDGELEGEYKKEDTIIYCRYEKIKKGRLIVQCVDENNEVIKENITTEKVGTEYNLEKVGEEIPGYKFLGVEGNTKGKYVEGDTIVTYKYKKRQKGNVIVVCIDENNEIIKRDVTTEEVDTNYDLKNVGEEIEGYSFEGVEGETKGKYKIEDTIVTYKYRKKQEPVTEEIRLPKTGDNNIIIYAGILVGAIILITIITKKENKENHGDGVSGSKKIR